MTYENRPYLPMRRKTLNIIEIKDRTPELTEKLLSVWESSVRATHLFLSPGAIEAIKAFVPQALAVVPKLIIIVRAFHSVNDE